MKFDPNPSWLEKDIVAAGLEPSDRLRMAEEARQERCREDELLNSRLRFFVTVATAGLGIGAFARDSWIVAAVMAFEMVVCSCWLAIGPRTRRRFHKLREVEVQLSQPFSWRDRLNGQMGGTPSVNAVLTLWMPLLLLIFFSVMEALTWLPHSGA